MKTYEHSSPRGPTGALTNNHHHHLSTEEHTRLAISLSPHTACAAPPSPTPLPPHRFALSLGPGVLAQYVTAMDLGGRPMVAPPTAAKKNTVVRDEAQARDGGKAPDHLASVKEAEAKASAAKPTPVEAPKAPEPTPPPAAPEPPAEPEPAPTEPEPPAAPEAAVDVSEPPAAEAVPEPTAEAPAEPPAESPVQPEVETKSAEAAVDVSETENQLPAAA